MLDKLAFIPEQTEATITNVLKKNCFKCSHSGTEITELAAL